MLFPFPSPYARLRRMLIGRVQRAREQGFKPSNWVLARWTARLIRIRINSVTVGIGTGINMVRLVSALQTHSPRMLHSKNTWVKLDPDRVHWGQTSRRVNDDRKMTQSMGIMKDLSYSFFIWAYDEMRIVNIWTRARFWYYVDERLSTTLLEWQTYHAKADWHAMILHLCPPPGGGGHSPRLATPPWSPKSVESVCFFIDIWCCRRFSAKKCIHFYCTMEPNT